MSVGGLSAQARDGEEKSAKVELARRRTRQRTVSERVGGSNSVVESQPSKLLVAGSIPVSRSSLRSLRELRLASRQMLLRVERRRDLSAEASKTRRRKAGSPEVSSGWQASCHESRVSA